MTIHLLLIGCTLENRLLKRKEKLKKKPTEINDRKHNNQIFMLQKKVTTEKPIKICGMKQ